MDSQSEGALLHGYNPACKVLCTVCMFSSLLHVNETHASILLSYTSLCLQNSLEKIDNCVHTGSDLFFVLYSTIDRSSFEEASLLCQYLLKTKNVNPTCLVLVGNKSDLKHFREVDEYEGRLLAQALECGFFQLSVSEGFDDSQNVLYNTLRQYVNTQKHGSPSIRVFIDSVLSRKKSMS